VSEKTFLRVRAKTVFQSVEGLSPGWLVHRNKSMEDFMANASQLNELLRFDPDWFTDPVPPWVLQVLDKALLRDLAVISLEHRRAAADLNNRAIDGAIAVLKKAKF
jgi:hypothetical protein